MEYQGQDQHVGYRVSTLLLLHYFSLMYKYNSGCSHCGNVVQLGLAFVLVNSDEATQRKMVVFVLLIIGGMNKLQSASLEMSFIVELNIKDIKD